MKAILMVYSPTGLSSLAIGPFSSKDEARKYAAKEYPNVSTHPIYVVEPHK